MNKLRFSSFAELYDKAHEAGIRVASSIPFENYGCGFAYVIVNGNTAFGRWVKQYKGWKKGYPSGITLHVREFGQSENHKLAYARAFAEVLNRAGVSARFSSRSD